jgi:hypothetical protein
LLSVFNDEREREPRLSGIGIGSFGRLLGAELPDD